MPAFLRYSKTVTLPAATPTPVDVPIHGARDWMIVVKNSGANQVTSITRAACAVNALFEPPVDVTAGIPLNGGDSLPAIRGLSEPAHVVRLMMTSTSGTTVDIEAGGW